MTYFASAYAGWLGAIFIGAVAVLPYLLGRSFVSVRLGIALPSDQPYLRRMWLHYWLAYAATALSFAHAWAAMSTGRMPRTSGVGMYLATLAMLLLLLQVFIGLTLQQKVLPARTSLRRVHFWTMAAVVVLVGAHLWMNG
jgi:hypothetical protein